MPREFSLEGTVAIPTPDGVVLIADFYIPVSPPSVLILLHGLGSNRQEWRPFIPEARQRGYGILCYDARGHNESRTILSGESIRYEEFDTYAVDPPWRKMIDDVEMVSRFLENEGIPPSRQVLVGASLGANVVLSYAPHRESLKALILLSAGLNYAGIDAIEPFLAVNNCPLFLLASEGDSYAYRSARLLNTLARRTGKKNISLRLVSEPGHGVSLLTAGLTETLFQWLEAAQCQDGEPDEKHRQ